jgi:hypothetical protein
MRPVASNSRKVHRRIIAQISALERRNARANGTNRKEGDMNGSDVKGEV